MKEIDELINKLKEDHFRGYVFANDAVTYNEVFSLYEEGIPKAINKRDDLDENGSQVFTMLMCQNLLLLKQVKVLEEEVLELKRSL